MSQEASLKASERARLRRARRALDDVESRSRSICHALGRVDALVRARVVAAYAAMRDEASVDAWIEAALSRGVIVLVPRVVGEGAMEFVPIASLDELVPGAWGIREPVGEPFEGSPDAILVPAVAYGRDGTRLGMGGGFYDRWLEAHPRAARVGVCFSTHLLEAVPAEPHDARVGWVVTDSEILTLE